MKKYSLLLLLLFITGCGNNNKNIYEGTGTIEAVDVTLSAKVPGEIKQINFEEGDKIKAGDTLMIIDSEALQYQLDQAEAGLNLSKAQLELLRKGARKEDIKQAEASLKQAEVNLDQAKKDFDRLSELIKTSSITQKQYDDAKSRYELTQEQLTAAKNNYEKMKRLSRPEEIEQGIARVNQSESGANLIKKNIKDSYIISPINGFIVEKYFEKGETVTQMSSLLKVADLSYVELYVYIPETEIGRVKLGGKATVSVDTFPEKSFTGKIVYISPEAEFTPKNIQTKDERTKLVFAVKVRIPNPDFSLKPGMPADAVIYY